MSIKLKLLNFVSGILLFSASSLSQNLLELPVNNFRSGSISGNGFGPRTTNQVVYFDKDRLDNGNMEPQSASPFAIAAPYNSVTFSFENQQFTSGFSYAGNPNNVTTGLVFGAGPDNADGVGPNGFGVQGVYPINSYDLLGAFGSNGGPRNGMFRSDYTATPNVSPYPIQSGSGIDAEGTYPTGGNDNNGGAFIFSCAQRLYELGLVHNSSTRHYLGDLVITFTRYMDQPVIHFAGLGGSFRYAPVGTDPNNLSTWVSTYFSTELELVNSNLTLTKLSGNEFLSVSGKNILNSALKPNGESFDIGTPPAGSFNNYGAASGSVRIDGQIVRVLRFKVYLRGSNNSDFSWSAPASAVVNGNRNPVTGDIWGVSVSASYCNGCIVLPATGMSLSAVLNNNDVLLSWKTLSETDTKQFEIERSTDGIHFTTISIQPATGNSPTETRYSLTDANMQTSVYYYRVKLVNNDNSFKYSNVVPVRKLSGNVKTVKIFPNPVLGQEQLKIEFSNAKGEYVIRLFNQTGQAVYSQKTIVNSTVQYVALSKNDLPAGTYLLKINNTVNEEVYTEKVIFQ